MPSRSFTLYLIGIKSFFNRLRFDLGREIAVGLSSLVLFATFYYVFNDFLNVQVAALSDTMRDRFAQTVGWTILVLATLAGGAFLKSERMSSETVALSAAYLGECPSVLKSYRIFRNISGIFLIHGLAWSLVMGLSVNWPPAVMVVTQGIMVATSLAYGHVIPRSVGRSDTFTVKPMKFRENKSSAIFSWRAQQILKRNRTARFCIVAGVPLSGLVWLSVLASMPAFVAVAAALACGFVVSLALPFQLAEDLRYAWAERAMGISHDDVIWAYQKVGMVLAAGCAVSCSVAYGLGTGLALPLGELNQLAKVAMAAALSPLVAPWLLFQIDARRPTVTMIVLLIVTLFLGTAIFAHWLSLILLLILRYYATGAQAGRYYRA